MKHNHLLLTALLTLLGLVGIALNLHADDFTYNANNYTCMQVGIDRVRFTLPTGNTWRTNDGVEMGNVYVSVNGGNNEAVFDWWCKKYSQVDEGCKIKAYKGGRFFLVGKVKDGWTSTTHSTNGAYYLSITNGKTVDMSNTSLGTCRARACLAF